jgi:hypothetical protein
MAKKKTTTKNKSEKATPPKPSAQKELLLVMIISIALGLGGGYALGVSQDDSTTSNAAQTTQKMTHSHGVYEVSAEEAPKVELIVTEDTKSGYNIKIAATDFTFTPESVNGENVIGEGHAHLYVDGQKVGRLYSPYYHYDGDFEGTKLFTVTLNANDHSEYTVDGDPITATQSVTHDSSSEDHDDNHSNSDMN